MTAAELAREHLGLELEPWQEHLMHGGYRLVPHGRRGYQWVAPANRSPRDFEELPANGEKGGDGGN